MGFSNLLTKKKENIESYFALEITHDLVKAAIWSVNDGVVSIVNIGEVIHVENDEPQGLLDAVDMALETANDELDQEPDKIVFGLPEHWVDDEGIISSKKKILKFLCDQLELKPLGYVVTLEAIVTFLKTQQGTPPTSIFVRLSKKQLLISLVQLGKIVKQTVIERQGDIAVEFKKGLIQFDDIKQFPARIILYNGQSDYEETKQKLLEVSWEDEFPFLHTPKIDSLSYQTSVEAVAIAGGREAAISLGFELNNSNSKKTSEIKNDITQDKNKEADINLDKKITEANDLSVIKNKLPEGFSVANHDLNVKQNEVVESKVNHKNNLVVDNTRRKALFNLKKITSLINYLKRNKKGDINQKNIENSGRIVYKDRQDVSRNKRSFKKSTRIILLILITFIFIGLIYGAWWAYINIPKSEIVLTITPQKIDKKINILASTEINQIDFDKNIVPILEKEISVKGNEQILTTGEKLIGDKASGTITIYNKTDKVKNFGKGTILIGPGKLRFILTEDVLVASKSAVQTDGGENIVFGKANANIEAGAIGEDYNLGDDGEFTFKDFSTDVYSAKIATTISGGKSTSLKVVSQEDIDLLKETIKARLENEAKQKLEQSSSGAQIILGDLFETTVINEKYSNEVGDESESVSAELEIKLIAKVIDKDMLDTVVMRSMIDSIPENYNLSSSGLNTKINVVFDNQNKKDKQTDISIYKVEVAVTASLIPKINFADIKKNIAGKYPDVVTDYFKSLPQVVHTTISIDPALPKQIATIPRKEENISIKIKEKN